ncbi:hypothetical protein BU24DRAFT_198036 [Aaosphaeria arxii CBS 175.79]|uniref:Ring-like domain-containing protein n=1 Tax=Aaosphaeria arxii CBS 175.79 TaxID=1450172 RepID=A0A6A5XTK4_9PLEO|nr:uncharacterized protein BU24DRAFT_198036 [Aaosphaeria arxii CBS 175.79]KAF2016283.1 hypothetical protein BU24DRAFT_198036 [Aaosphaeria arxii CBS 175.79]
MSLAYINKKLRRQSKQDDVTTTEVPTTAPPAPAVTAPSEEPAASPVLDEEDEKFLQRLAAIAQEPEGPAPPLPTRPVVVLDGGEKKVGKDAQEAIMDGANAVPLPVSPPEVDAQKGGLSRKESVMSYFSRLRKTGDKDKGKEKESKGKDKVTSKDKARAADDLMAAAEAAKVSEADEVEKENQDLTQILDQLNLSAVNNRVFSFSKESEELLNKFKLVLKDVVNGAPTAYDDMTKLFTESETQMKKMYESLPPFLQNLVKSLPTKMTAALGPEILAATAEKPGFDAKQKSGFKPSKPKIPSLKQLISAQGAVATMLKSILNFLKLRFPALMTGTNVILSLAVFLLMFVFWYCHKRGRETRLEKEGLAAQEGDSAFASSASSFTDNDAGSGGGEASASAIEKGESSREKPEPPLIIGDDNDRDVDVAATAAVNDLPSVAHLPDPKSVPLPETPAREDPLPVPGNK